MADGWTYQLTFQGETFELSGGEQIAGRSRACDVSVPDASVSRKHARLKPGPGHVLVQDLNSSNGTFINDRRVQGEDAAEDGDVLRFGDAEVKVSIDNPAAYQTMRLPTGGASTPDLPNATQEALKKPPGPATTMLAAESVKLAAQAELDRQAAEAAAAGETADSIPVIPESAAAETAAPEPATSAPPPPPAQVPSSSSAQVPPSSPTQPAPEPTSSYESQPAPAQPSPPPATPSPPSQSPLATQRLEIPSQPLPHEPASGQAAPEPAAPEPAATQPAATQPLAERASREPPWARPAPDTPSPHATQRFDSSKFVPSPPEPEAHTEPETHTEPESSSLATQRVPLPPSGPPAPPASTPADSPSTPAPPPAAPDPGADPAATRRLEIPPQPPSSQPPPSQAPPSQPPGPAATVAMTREQLDAARAELGAPAAPRVAEPPKPTPEPTSAPAPEPTSPAEAPAPAPAAETPIFGGPGDGGQFQGFDFDEDEPQSTEVRPPDDFVPGSGRAWQSEDAEAATAESAPVGPPAVPTPGAADPGSASAGSGVADRVQTEAPVTGAPDPGLQVPDLPAPSIQVPDLPTPAAPEPAAPGPAAPEPPSQTAPEPNFDRPVGSWAEKPPLDGDATFADVEYDSSTVVPPDESSWEPPDIEQGGGSAVPSFDKPTPPAAPPQGTGGFDKPTPPAAPPPAQMHREERNTAGAGGLLPALDELDGSIAGPEMDIPYQPDPDPTQPVPIVTSHRRVDAGAGFLLRAIATVLDLLWISAVTLAAWMVSGNNQLVSIFVSTACQMGIVVAWAVWGTSPGKKALGLAVEGKTPQAEGGGIGFLRAVIRAAGYLVSALALGIGFLMIAFSPEKRGLHDRIAGTWVRRRG